MAVVGAGVTCRHGRSSLRTTVEDGAAVVAGAVEAAGAAVPGDLAGLVDSVVALVAVEARVDHGDRRRCE